MTKKFNKNPLLWPVLASPRIWCCHGAERGDTLIIHTRAHATGESATTYQWWPAGCWKEYSRSFFLYFTQKYKMTECWVQTQGCNSATNHKISNPAVHTETEPRRWWRRHSTWRQSHVGCSIERHMTTIYILIMCPGVHAKPAPCSSGNNIYKLAPSINLELDSMKWNPYNIIDSDPEK